MFYYIILFQVALQNNNSSNTSDDSYSSSSLHLNNTNNNIVKYDTNLPLNFLSGASSSTISSGSSSSTMTVSSSSINPSSSNIISSVSSTSSSIGNLSRDGGNVFTSATSNNSRTIVNKKSILKTPIILTTQKTTSIEPTEDEITNQNNPIENLVINEDCFTKPIIKKEPIYSIEEPKADEKETRYNKKRRIRTLNNLCNMNLCSNIELLHKLQALVPSISNKEVVEKLSNMRQELEDIYTTYKYIPIHKTKSHNEKLQEEYYNKIKIYQHLKRQGRINRNRSDRRTTAGQNKGINNNTITRTNKIIAIKQPNNNNNKMKNTSSVVANNCVSLLKKPNTTTVLPASNTTILPFNNSNNTNLSNNIINVIVTDQ